MKIIIHNLHLTIQQPAPPVRRSTIDMTSLQRAWDTEQADYRDSLRQLRAKYWPEASPPAQGKAAGSPSPAAPLSPLSAAETSKVTALKDFLTRNSPQTSCCPTTGAAVPDAHHTSPSPATAAPHPSSCPAETPAPLHAPVAVPPSSGTAALPTATALPLRIPQHPASAAIFDFSEGVRKLCNKLRAELRPLLASPSALITGLLRIIPFRRLWFHSRRQLRLHHPQ